MVIERLLGPGWVVYTLFQEPPRPIVYHTLYSYFTRPLDVPCYHLMVIQAHVVTTPPGDSMRDPTLSPILGGHRSLNL